MAYNNTHKKPTFYGHRRNKIVYCKLCNRWLANDELVLDMAGHDIIKIIVPEPNPRPLLRKQ